MEVQKNISKQLFNPIRLPRELGPSFLVGDSIYFSSTFTQKSELIEYKKTARSDREQEKDLKELKNEK